MKKLGRPRSATPVSRNGRLWARHGIRQPDGSYRRQWFDLGTSNPAVAAAKNAQIIQRLNAGEVIEPEARASIAEIETFNQAADRICRQRQKDGTGVSDQVQRLRDYVRPHIGRMRVTDIRAGHLQEVLEKACDLGKSKETLTHIRKEMKCIFQALWREEQIPENPCQKGKVLIPKRAKDDGRPRQILTDEEFLQFVGCALVPRTIRMMALCSRMLGGMRTSDLHAWDWSHIDTKAWATARVKRAKTRGWGFMEIPETLGFALEEWWFNHGEPKAGPVFPVTRGPNRGKRRGKIGYARMLRVYLLRAGVTRKELHESTEWSRRVDFHSFRRAYASALGDADVNAQTAMKLTGHTKLETHLRYVTRLRPVGAPAAAIPVLPAGNGNKAYRAGARVDKSGVNHEKVCKNNDLANCGPGVVHNVCRPVGISE